MQWLFVVVGALMVLFAVVVNARKWWRATEAWRYRDPDANEPSDAWFVSWRAAIVLAGVALVVLGLWMNVSISGSITGRVDPRPAVDSVAESLGTSARTVVPFDWNGRPEMDRLDLQGELDDQIRRGIADVNLGEYRAADLAVDSSSQESDTYRYTVNAAGDNHYCLVVRAVGEPVLAGEPVYSAPFPGDPLPRRPITDNTVVVPISTSVTDGACE